MTKYNKRVDKNQPAIVKELRKEGYSVSLDKDDIFIGYSENNKWFEIKEHSPFQKNGTIEAGFIKDSQYKILCEWKGQYNICWTIHQIKSVLWDQRKPKSLSMADSGITPFKFRKHYKEWLTPKELNRLRQETWWNLE